MKSNSNFKIEKINIKNIIIDSFFILLGTFVMALGFKIFLTPHDIVPGGFMGIAKIIHDLLTRVNFYAIDISVWYIILNIFLYVYALKKLGLNFGIRAGVGIFSYSLFVKIIEILPFDDIINNQFVVEESALGSVGMFIIYSIYGGVLMGIGLGLVFRANGSTGGCDLLAIIINKFMPDVTTGQIVIFVDGIVIILSAIAYSSLILPLFALITIFICGKVSDMFVDGVKALRAYYIITDKKEEVAQEIFNTLHRGVTDIKCQGMYTHNDRDMLLVIVRRVQIMKLKSIVRNIDENAFMFSSIVKEAYGNGFLKNQKIESFIARLKDKSSRKNKSAKVNEKQQGETNNE